MKIEEELNQNKFQNIQHKAMVNIRFTSNFISNIQNSFLNSYGLTEPQFNILRILRGAKGELNINTIKERMIEKSPNLTRLMDKLDAKKFIIRSNSADDRRVVFAEITEIGLEILTVLDAAINEKKNILVPDSLTDEEAETLSLLLDKVREAY
jgi:MarR family transcriptional regulator, 2-MHQ and catechol-resistance regulon repressor